MLTSYAGELALRQTFRKITPAWALPLVRGAYHRLYRGQLRLRFVWSDVVAKQGSDPLPPARLRFRVSETLDPGLFLAVGRTAARRLREVLDRLGRPLEGTSRVLEFGCGCGRVVGPLAREFPRIQFSGTDVDAEAIAWCGSHIEGVHFLSNQELPPLGYESGFFDLVYCISVFTHLDDRHTRLWLSELNRVLRPGGTLVLTIHGEHVWKGLGAGQQGDVERDGFLFEITGKLKGIQPDWYQTSYHASAYILGVVGELFDVLGHIPQGMGYQDVIIVQKR